MSDRLATRACETVRDDTTAKLAAEVAAPRGSNAASKLMAVLALQGRMVDRYAVLTHYAESRGQLAHYKARAIEEARALARKIDSIVDELEAESHA